MSDDISREFRLVEYEDGTWSATDEDTGFTYRGDSWTDALLQFGIGPDRLYGDIEVDGKKPGEMTDEELEAAAKEAIADAESIADDLDELDESQLDGPEESGE